MESLQQQGVVQTPYGDGRVVSYREADDMCTIQLARFGATLYATQTSLLPRNPGMAMDLAYKALEATRQQKLALRCQLAGVVVDMPNCHTVCTSCLLLQDHVEKCPDKEKAATTTAKMPPTNERVPAWVSKLNQSRRDLVSNLRRQETRVPPACRTCGNPTCRSHQSVAFGKQNMVLCQSCEALFDLDFGTLLDTQDCHTPDLQTAKDQMQHMVDMYRRLSVLLQHAVPFIESVLVPRLQANQIRNNRVGAGAAGVGILSSALGLAGTAAIFTPAGVPLLVASLALSGSSVAVTASNLAIHHYYESNPEQAADQILVMYSLLSCLVEAASTLQSLAVGVDKTNNGFAKDEASTSSSNTDEDDSDDGHESESDDGDRKISPSQRSNDTVPIEKVVYSLRLLRQTGTGIDLANTAATTGTTMRSSSGAAASGLLNSGANIFKAVPVLGAAFSGFCMAMDADRLKHTLDQIKAGDPSEKAQALLHIQEGLVDGVFPPSDEFHAGCTSYFETIEKAASKQMPQ